MNVVDTEAPQTSKDMWLQGEKIGKLLVRLLALHGLRLEKKDIISAELEACQKLLKYAMDAADKKTIEKEIAELKMTLDPLP